MGYRLARGLQPEFSKTSNHSDEPNEVQEVWFDSGSPQDCIHVDARRELRRGTAFSIFRPDELYATQCQSRRGWAFRRVAIKMSQEKCLVTGFLPDDVEILRGCKPRDQLVSVRGFAETVSIE